uniref:Peptidase S9 prolyl oligopeptidase catalytic domain-containing protein n=1 Tax=Ascaris lumbricoides TaxID=6252 RepID=A0A9J2PAQ6_ASCLU
MDKQFVKRHPIEEISLMYSNLGIDIRFIYRYIVSNSHCFYRHSKTWLPHARNREPHNNNTNYVLPPANYNQLSLESLLMGAGVVQQDHVVVWLSDDRLVMSDMLGNFLLMNTSDLSHKSRVFIEKDQLKSDDKGKKIIFNSDARLVAVSTGLSQVGCVVLLGVSAFEQSTICNSDGGSTTSEGVSKETKPSFQLITKFSKKTKNFLRNHICQVYFDEFFFPVLFVRNYQPIGPRATGDEALQLFEWNPQMGAKDFVFVYESNIYYQADARQRGSALPITFTGGAFNYNGITDWLYEEEIFSSSKAVWWSPSGKYLAYASFDDRSVDRVMVPHYDSADVYPRHEEVAYPKAGTANQPLVSLWIWQKQRNVTYQVDPPTTLMNAHKNGSYYLYSAQWIVLKGENNGTEELLLSVWANRQQNEVFISACRYRHSCIESLHIQFDINGRKMWSEPSDFKIDFYSTSGYFVILPRKYDDGNVYNHIAHVNLVNASPPSGSITAYHGGPYDVKQIVGYNRQKDEIYFLSAGGSIARMLLYRARYASNGSGANSPECLTCNMESCPSSRVNFAPSGKQFVLFCHLAYHSTKTYLKKVDEISSDAHVGLLLPPNFDPAFLYPVLLYTYAGPNSNLNVMETPWDLMSYFANKRQYVVVMIDARGSSNRGWMVKEQLYMNLGGPEVDDQIEVTRRLLHMYPFMDKHRVAVLGWSYGGFVTAHIAVRDHGSTFQCAVCIAPVVDFRFYDSAYTERYMGLPNDNVIGYKKTNLLSDSLVGNFRQVKLMLAHGDADDNVHYQNSALLASALQQQGIHFKQLVYTNQDHTIRSAIGHLYMEVDRFLLHDCFGFTDSQL